MKAQLITGNGRSYETGQGCYREGTTSDIKIYAGVVRESCGVTEALTLCDLPEDLGPKSKREWKLSAKPFWRSGPAVIAKNDFQLLLIRSTSDTRDYDLFN